MVSRPLNLMTRALLLGHAHASPSGHIGHHPSIIHPSSIHHPSIIHPSSGADTRWPWPGSTGRGGLHRLYFLSSRMSSVVLHLQASITRASPNPLDLEQNFLNSTLLFSSSPTVLCSRSSVRRLDIYPSAPHKQATARTRHLDTGTQVRESTQCQQRRKIAERSLPPPSNSETGTCHLQTFRA